MAVQTTSNLGNPFRYNVNVEEQRYGDRAQRNYDFLELLWDPVNGANFRASLITVAQTNQAFLKSFVDASLLLNLPIDTYVVLLDLESGRMVYDNALAPLPPGGFYILMLPANPGARLGDQSYKEAQMWDEAWHHAVRETGGM